MIPYGFVIISLGNGLVLDDTKPSAKPMLMLPYCQLNPQELREI